MSFAKSCFIVVSNNSAAGWLGARDRGDEGGHEVPVDVRAVDDARARAVTGLKGD